MTTKRDHIIEYARSLDDNEFRRLLNDLWDDQIAREDEHGPLAEMAAEALAEHKAGKTRPL